MKTFLSLTVAFLVAGLAMADSALAQVRERVVTVSTLSVSGPPVPRQAPFYRPGPPAHAQHKHRSPRQAPFNRPGPPAHAQHHNRPPRRDLHRQQSSLADWYARQAVAQAHEGWRLGCANNHPRWSTSYREHYQWAFHNNRRQARREIEQRDRILSRCWAYR